MKKALRVMAIDLYGTGAPQYAMDDSVDAFRKCGHEVNAVDSKKDYFDEEITRFSPDLFFTINHLYLTSGVKGMLMRRKIPCVSWFFDIPYPEVVSREPLSQYEIGSYIFFVGDRVWVQMLKDFGFKNVFYLPFAANPEIFRQINLTKEEKETYSCNISFAGGSIFQVYKEFYKNKEVHSLLKEGVRLQCENPYVYSSDIIDELQKNLPTPLFKDADEKRSFKINLELAAAALNRKNTLEEVSGFGLDLYGDDGWRSLLNGIKGVRFKGGIDNRSELPKLYNASRINLNITRPQAKTGLNMRVFDILACGAFLVSDYRRDMAELFELGRDVICYHTRDELSELVKYFLDHPRERESIAKNGRERILKDHKYENRIDVIMDTFHQVFG